MKGAEKNNLTAVDICSILKTCSVSRVMKLKYHGLEVDFSASLNEEPTYTNYGNKRLSKKSEAALSEVQIATAKDSLVNEEFRIKEEQLAELLITNPAQAEQMLIDGALEDEDYGTTEYE